MNRTCALLSLLVVWGCPGNEPMGASDAGPEDTGGAVPDNCTDDTPCALQLGTMATDYVAPNGDKDRWTFDVPQAGQLIDILVTNQAMFSPIRLQVTLFDPAGSSVRSARFDGNGMQRVNIQTGALVAGKYAVVVNDVGDDQADRRNPYYVQVDVRAETDSHEPNNMPATATPLMLGSSVVGTIGAQGDQDWYSFQVPANKLIQVSLGAPAPAGPTPQLHLRYELWNAAADVRIAEAVEAGTGVVDLRENRAVGNVAGMYFIKISDDESDGMQADAMRIYQLQVDLVDEPDAQDLAAPNETRQTATVITAGRTVTGFIAAKSDLDYFSINVPQASMAQPQLIVVEAIMGGTSPVDLQFDVLESDAMTQVCASSDNCKSLRFFADGTRQAARLTTSHPLYAPGRYYVVVRDHQDNDFDTAVSYTLRVELPAEPEGGELYNDPETIGGTVVRPVTSTAGAQIDFPWVRGYISHQNDVDWFTFNIPGSMGAPAAQNGDWLFRLEFRQAASAVEFEAFMFSSFGGLEQYGGFGKQCRMPMPGDLDPTGCQFPDGENAVDVVADEAHGDCLVVFRERTDAGPHFFRISDLNRDDFSLAVPYEFRLTLFAKCTPQSLCSGRYTDVNGGDLCARP